MPLPDSPKASGPRARARLMLEQQMTEAFGHLLTPDPQIHWEGITEDQLAEGVVQALHNVGARSGRGNALLLTFMQELQEKINFTN